MCTRSAFIFQNTGAAIGVAVLMTDTKATVSAILRASWATIPVAVPVALPIEALSYKLFSILVHGLTSCPRVRFQDTYAMDFEGFSVDLKGSTSLRFC